MCITQEVEKDLTANQRTSQLTKRTSPATQRNPNDLTRPHSNPRGPHKIPEGLTADSTINDLPQSTTGGHTIIKPATKDRRLAVESNLKQQHNMGNRVPKTS